MCHFDDALLGNILRFVHIQTIKVNKSACIVVFIHMVKDPPGNIPFDPYLHFLVLLLAYSFLWALALALLEELLGLCESVVSLHVVLHGDPFVSLFGAHRLLFVSWAAEFEGLQVGLRWTAGA